jgi:hypothetical protein
MEANGYGVSVWVLILYFLGSNNNVNLSLPWFDQPFDQITVLNYFQSIYNQQ